MAKARNIYGPRTVGDVSEIEVTYKYPETAAVFMEVLRGVGLNSRLSGPTSVVVWVPPLTAEERRQFDARDEDELIKRLSAEAQSISAQRRAREYVARRPGDNQRYRFRAPSLEVAREHARRHLGPSATAEPVETDESRDPGTRRTSKRAKRPSKRAKRPSVKRKRGASKPSVKRDRGREFLVTVASRGRRHQIGGIDRFRDGTFVTWVELAPGSHGYFDSFEDAVDGVVNMGWGGLKRGDRVSVRDITNQ